MKGFLQSLPVVGAAFMDISPQEVQAFWSFMQGHFRTSSINKGDAIEMELVAQLLDALGIQSRERFLRSYTTTIGRRIYTPFEVGVPRTNWDLWSQVVICVHEHQHVVQHDREGVVYELAYLADRAARAQWEAEAYRSNLELHFWRHGTVPRARPIAERLAEYGCRPIDIDVVTKALTLSSFFIRGGAIVNEATHVALGWLNEHVPRLRAGDED